MQQISLRSGTLVAAGWALVVLAAGVLVGEGLAIAMAAIGGAFLLLGLCGTERAQRAAPVLGRLPLIHNHGFEARPPDLVPAELRQSYMKGLDIKLADLVPPGEGWVEDRTFEDCIFRGPAMIHFGEHTQVIDVVFDAAGMTPDAVYWEVPDNAVKFGGLTFTRCVFRRCEFRGNFGIIATKAQLDHMRKIMQYGPAPWKGGPRAGGPQG